MRERYWWCSVSAIQSPGVLGEEAALSAPVLTIRVLGTPAPQGSKRHVGRGIMVESSKRLAPWREAVLHAALDAIRAQHWEQRYVDPVVVDIVFVFPRPRHHYRTGRNAHLLRDNAPRVMANMPDVEKCVRGVLDPLTNAGVFHDDRQVAVLSAAKVYEGQHEGLPGAHIIVRPVDFP